MGGACSKGGKISADELDELKRVDHVIKKPNKENNMINSDHNINNISSKLNKMKSFGSLNKKNKKVNDFDDSQPPTSSPLRFFSCEFRFSGDDKVTPRGSSFMGRASFSGLEKAVDILDALGSSMTNLNASGFLSGKTAKANTIDILAFEVANTITLGEKLMQSMSEENVRFIKEEVIPSKGAQYLVSPDTKVLLNLVANDKRKELDIFCKEVTRFGNHCKDPQWHNLGRYFEKLDSESAAYRHQREQAEAKMQYLVTLVDHTSELYHELNSYDRFEHDYRAKVEEMKALNLPRKGEHLMTLNSELRQQKKVVMSLKRKSLWSRKLEEVIEKLVDIVAFIFQEIKDVYGTGRPEADEGASISAQTLGLAGLSLHYANIINHIDNIASRPASLPPNIRDSLYRGLPDSIKTALRSNLLKVGSVEELEIPQIKAEMDKILEWLAPMAMNTLKVHQGFGWVGEWANASAKFNKRTAANGNPIRLQTLYHANKEKTDAYILTLVTMLHRLISGVKRTDYELKPLPLRSPSKKILVLNSSLKIYPSIYDGSKSLKVELSEEDRRLLERMSKSILIPGISKSQEFFKTSHRTTKSWPWSRSMESSPYREQRNHRPELSEVSDLKLSSGGIEAPF